MGAFAQETMTRESSLFTATAVLVITFVGAAPALAQWYPNPANGREYALTAPLDWHAAEAAAVTAGGHLATVRDATEHAWLLATFGNGPLWIGLNDIVQEGTYVWTSGESPSYRSWCSGQPSGPVAPDEDAVQIANYPGWCIGDYNDQNPADLMPGIMERPSRLTGFRWVQRGNAPAGVVSSAGAFDRSRGHTILQSTFPPTTDTWRWFGSSWSVSPGNALPGWSSALRMAFDATGGGVIALLGGQTWRWNGTAWFQLNPTAAPPALGGYALAADLGRRRIVCFGGNSVFTVSDQTWEWQGSNWVQRVPNPRPPARTGHAIAYDASRAVTVLFGGFDGTIAPTALNDTWEFTGLSWTQRNPAHVPPARGGHTLTHIEGTPYTVLFGGTAGGTNSTPMGDTWVWDGNDWTPLTGLPQSPPPRQGHSAFFFPSPRGAEVVIVGGTGSGSVLQDTWTLTHTPALAAYRLLGFGGCGPRWAPRITHDGVPEVGTSFQIGATDADASVPAVCFFGFGTTFRGLPLPFDLTSIGMTGCSMLTSADVGVPGLTDPGGKVAWTVVVPNLQSLVGRTFRNQIFAGLLGANPLNVAASQAGEGVFGL